MSKDMSGVRLAYSTTNGTVSILKGADAALTLVGAFANLDALCERLKKEGRDVVLLCSGWQNDFCLEDTLVAGAIIDKLGNPHGDAAAMALSLWKAANDNPFAYCRNASHVHRLQAFGPQAVADIDFAFKMNTCPLVPILKNNTLSL